MIFNEVHVNVGTGTDIRIPLPTRLGTIPELFPLSEAVGIAPPEVNVINLSIDEIVHILNILIVNGILDSKIRKKILNRSY